MENYNVGNSINKILARPNLNVDVDHKGVVAHILNTLDNVKGLQHVAGTITIAIIGKGEKTLSFKYK